MNAEYTASVDSANKEVDKSPEALAKGDRKGTMGACPAKF
jgi:hypothetical protein